MARHACIIDLDSIKTCDNLIKASQKTFETLLGCKKVCESIGGEITM